ncbi:hypothetical protein ABEX55_22850 [Priestia endophytica]|uniref:hypothetical protein n=1 Tax=Priestia endophytica TaxID=135735 RepID=UPI003D298DFD
MKSRSSTCSDTGANTNVVSPVFNINVTGCCDNQPLVDTACTCSGLLNEDFLDTMITADICADCNLEGSFLNINTTDFTFPSTFVSPPLCGPVFSEELGSGTSLQTGGTGFVTTSSGMFPASFHLVLLERTGGLPDDYQVSISYINELGMTTNFVFIGVLIDDDTVEVQDCPLNPSITSEPAPVLKKSIASSHRKVFKIVNGVIIELNF